MKAGRAKRAPEPVPIVPLRQWTAPERPLRLRLPAKRREYSGRPLLVTMKGQVPFRLLWSTTLGALTILASAWTEAAWKSTTVEVVENEVVISSHRWYAWDEAGNPTKDGQRPERWHIARAVETAKAATAQLREVKAPALSKADEAWCRQQLSTLGVNWPLDNEDDEEDT